MGDDQFQGNLSVQGGNPEPSASPIGMPASDGMAGSVNISSTGFDDASLADPSLTGDAAAAEEFASADEDSSLAADIFAAAPEDKAPDENSFNIDSSAEDSANIDPEMSRRMAEELNALDASMAPAGSYVAPSAPAAPAAPAEPMFTAPTSPMVAPAAPAAPVAPVAPDPMMAPAAPVPPVAPAAPIAPPVAPAAPVAPVAPDPMMAPAAPVPPVAPAAPIAPPVAPVAPVAPEPMMAPEAPTAPVMPDMYANPAAPAMAAPVDPMMAGQNPAMAPVQNPMMPDQQMQMAGQPAINQAQPAAEQKQPNKKMLIIIAVSIVIIIVSVIVIMMSMGGKGSNTNPQGVQGNPDEKPVIDDGGGEEEDKTQRVGVEDHGYVTVPQSWLVMRENLSGNEYGYSDNTSTNMVIMNSAAMGGSMNAKNFADTQFAQAKSDGMQQPQMAAKKIGNYDGYEIFYYSKADSKWTYKYVFEAEDARVHYIRVIVEDNTSDLINSIPNSWSKTNNTDTDGGEKEKAEDGGADETVTDGGLDGEG